MKKENANQRIKGKKEFFNNGTCSRTFFYILNREFGYTKELEEKSLDLLAGGIKQLGYQCGMLWGASMGVGAEAYRRHGNSALTISATINTTQKLMNSFEDISGSIDCEDITNTDFSKEWEFAKYMFTGRFYNCFKLADNWGQQAVDIAKNSLDIETEAPDYEVFSCATEVLKQMNATEEETYMVSGLAGGMGLIGTGCGALGAAIWKKTLETLKNTDSKTSFKDPATDKIIQNFYKETDYKVECSEICGRKFKSLKEHSDYIKNGGCEKLISILATKT